VLLYWLLGASVQKSCCFHHPHDPFFSLFSGKYLELLVKWSLMLADSGTDIPSSQYKALEILSSDDAQGLANEPATPACS
jgi:hypothetical protein